MSMSNLSEVKLKDTTFDNCNLSQAQIFRTNLKGIDFSNCNITGIVVGIEDIKGLTVNEFQALELSKLLEIKIK